MSLVPYHPCGAEYLLNIEYCYCIGAQITFSLHWALKFSFFQLLGMLAADTSWWYPFWKLALVEDNRIYEGHSLLGENLHLMTSQCWVLKAQLPYLRVGQVRRPIWAAGLLSESAEIFVVTDGQAVQLLSLHNLAYFSAPQVGSLEPSSVTFLHSHLWLAIYFLGNPTCNSYIFNFFLSV